MIGRGGAHTIWVKISSQAWGECFTCFVEVMILTLCIPHSASHMLLHLSV